jgi:hypothetical protein
MMTACHSIERSMRIQEPVIREFHFLHHEKIPTRNYLKLRMPLVLVQTRRQILRPQASTFNHTNMIPSKNIYPQSNPIFCEVIDLRTNADLCHFMMRGESTASPGQKSILGGPRSSCAFVSGCDVPPLGKGSGLSGVAVP